MSRSKFTSQPQVPIQDLLLDVGNARIRNGQDQGDCIQRILRKETQLLALMTDIAEYGLSTAQILVAPSGDGKWIVRDGNRRVAALKLLSNPAYAIDAKVRKQILSIAERFPDFPTSIDVLSCDDPITMRLEMRKRHSGALGGVGQLDWSAYLRTVFQVSGGEPDQYKRAGQYVMWAEDQGVTVEDEFPISTITRLINAQNLDALGFAIERDELVLSIAKEDAKRLAARVIYDFATSRKKVEDVFSPAAAKVYITALRAEFGMVDLDRKPDAKPGGDIEEKPDNKGGSGGSAGAGGSSPGADSGAGAGSGATNPSGGNDKSSEKPNEQPDGAGGAKRGEGTARKASWDRPRLFTRGNPGFDLPRGFVKANNIVAELKQLGSKETPLAVAALFRCLVEMSVDQFQRTFAINKNNALAKDMSLVATKMLALDWLTAHQAEVVFRYTKSGEEGLFSVKTMQKYLHSPDAHANYQTLNTMWDEIGFFVGQCWRPKV